MSEENEEVTPEAPVEETPTEAPTATVCENCDGEKFCSVCSSKEVV